MGFLGNGISSLPEKITIMEFLNIFNLTLGFIYFYTIEPKLESSWIVLGDEGWIARWKTEVEYTGNKGNVFKFIDEVHFCPFIFFI